MNTFHNPDRFMSDLRQILSQGRKRFGLLVGAGAPMSLRVNSTGELVSDGSPLMPGVEALTAQSIDALVGPQKNAAKAIQEELGATANIESILTRVRLLQQALGPAQVHGLDSEGYKSLGTEMCKKIGEVVAAPLPKGRNAYTELVSWVSGTLRAHAVEIFTTNYDLLFEEAFERARASYFDGFTGGNLPFFDPVSVASDDLPPRWSRLWKLHGSLGWALEGDSVVRGRGRAASQLVYPDHLKYELTQKQPYSALFERLRQFLLSPDSVLLVSGFSFRDAHICAVLDEALAMNANASVMAFQYMPLASEEPACKLAYERPNLSVYASDGAVIGGVQGTWRPGDPPKNWESIRATFWGRRQRGEQDEFLLGDFALLTRFCALAQATDISSHIATPDLIGEAMEGGAPAAIAVAVAKTGESNP
ncbi:SIR2 family protein [Stenotrophomonas sp.]|uniref:SIR2 family NAD-dependent protein deacylase n=1 Tax=Stenotrophomonas sp. TaxID=69392 RepID=UPI0028A2910C|nr:SIR2 family protein [Stenotrophomonas sp.]